MRHGKSKPKPAAEPKNDLVPTNLNLERELKNESLRFVASLGYSLSGYVGKMLEVQLIAAGRWTPKEPRIDPMPTLLKKKTE